MFVYECHRIIGRVSCALNIYKQLEMPGLIEFGTKHRGKAMRR